MFHFLPAISSQQAYVFSQIDVNILLSRAKEMGTLLQQWQDHRRKLTAANDSY